MSSNEPVSKLRVNRVGSAVVEEAREIPVAGEYDVLICGGGTAGAPAAIYAARNGANTGLIESYGFLGGTPSCCIMPAWHGLQHITKGPLVDFFSNIPRAGRCPETSKMLHVEPESFKQLIMEEAVDAGVHLHLHTLIVDVIREGGVVKGIITESKSGRRAFLAKRIIDCTGDADICHLAGAKTFTGDKDGITQGMSLRFRIGYINFEKYFDWIAENRYLFCNIGDEEISRLRRLAREGEDFFLPGNLEALYDEFDKGKTCPRGSYFNCSSIRPGELSINATRINYLDGTKEEDLTTAEIECRKQAHAIYRFLLKHVPGFEDAKMIETACQIGVRESRRIEGDVIVTEEDCRQGRRFPDEILSSGVTFDMHDPRGYSCEHVRTRVGIPYRALLPKGLDNVLVAGRCISSDHVANSSLRMMINAFQLGCIAGMAAALSLKHVVSPRDLPYPALRQAVTDLGIMP